jgi:DNA-directed RNA polymerase subunit RPC12/RpoP
MTQEFKTSLMPEPVCPYCGYKERDWWEWDIEQDQDEITECGSCGEEYRYHVDITVQFTTAKYYKDPTVHP